MSEPLVLGIESTCDETGVGLVRGTQLLVDRTATSMDEYARYGGIIPEIASRAHLESFLPTLDAALDEADVQASTTSLRYTHEEVFGSIREGLNAKRA